MNTDSMEELERLVSRLIDERLTEADATRLDALLSESPEALGRYHELLDNHEALCAIYPGDVYEASLDSTERHVHITTGYREPTALAAGNGPDAISGQGPRLVPSAHTLSQNGWLWAAAAVLLVAVGLAGYFLGQGRGDSPATLPIADKKVDQTDGDAEQTIAGHATLRRALGVQWSGDASSYREGDVLPAGMLQFDDGLAEIDFFCGATLIVEGPATLDLESDWSVRVVKGRLRANVPPAARGFIVKAAGSEIIDLGTEFALEVGSENARLEVLDGEVELRGGEHDGNHLITGQRQWLRGTRPRPEAFEELSTVDDLQRRREDAETQQFAEWKKHSQQLRTDERLIAYYPISKTEPTALAAGSDGASGDRNDRPEASAFGSRERVVPNAASTGSSLDGQLVGPVDRTIGRFGAQSAGLEFDRPGARVRARIDGEFQAFTFVCWARIDSLEHRYNALFMGDGYENGEPHWQIRDDGSLMFSVMVVDDTQDVRHFSEIEQRVVTQAGLHRVYYTEPFWDISKSGQWFHIAAVYDPIGRRVVQYVNGEQISSEDITDKFHVNKLRIGPAEIGNWGQPFRKTPWFAVRNLNGTIDELAIFNAALTSKEIQDLHEKGKPLGY